ncbi:hypothetical protein [Pseudomonas paeninsulae]|uniref:hypothetical protein n=1 Tax=Pseudomonas paeninsulae TaxID=3110772 RepID=UPI002D77DE45|nr:hypothetical protein [Pseudomonas sp. IT1137]
MAQDWRSFGLLALSTLGLRAAGQAAHAAFVKDARQLPIQVDASVFDGQVVQILAWAELNPLPRLFDFTPASRCCRQPLQIAHPMDYGPVGGIPEFFPSQTELCDTSAALPVRLERFYALDPQPDRTVAA